MILEDYIQRRNTIQLRAETRGDGARCWTELGVANRHIERVVMGTLKLQQVEPEIVACLRRVEKLYE
jgi:hypothetical protein